MLAVGLDAEWGGTGSEKVGADRTSTLTPNFYFGKGANDLPDGLWWAKPFALTGVIGYAVPLAHEPRALQSGFALEYSFRYLSSHVRDVGLPSVINQLTPLVEVQLTTPIADRMPSTGTINPGLIWSGTASSSGWRRWRRSTAPAAARWAPSSRFTGSWTTCSRTSIGRPIW